MAEREHVVYDLEEVEALAMEDGSVPEIVAESEPTIGASQEAVGTSEIIPVTPPVAMEISQSPMGAPRPLLGTSQLTPSTSSIRMEQLVVSTEPPSQTINVSDLAPVTSEQASASKPKRKRKASSTKAAPSTPKTTEKKQRKSKAPYGRMEKLPEEDCRKNDTSKKRLSSVCSNLKTLDELFNKDDPNRLQIYFKAKFVKFGSKGEEPVEVNYKHGSDYEAAPSHCITTDQVKQCVREVMESFAQPSTSQRINETTPVKTPTFSQFKSPAAIPSPVLTSPAPRMTSCARKTCSFPPDDVWIGCSWENCDYWIHIKCLGYPTANSDQVKLMPPFFCPVHVFQVKKN